MAAGYDKQVATIWTLAFDQLERTKPTAIGLLRLLAYCAPEQIPLITTVALGRTAARGQTFDYVEFATALVDESTLTAGTTLDSVLSTLTS